MKIVLSTYETVEFALKETATHSSILGWKIPWIEEFFSAQLSL